MSRNPRYLVVAPQGLGDALEATPFIAALKAAQPSASIDALVTRAQPRLLFGGLSGLVDNVIFLPFWESGPVEFIRELLTQRWRHRYSASFLMYPASRWEYQVLMRAFPATRRFSHRYFDDRLKSLLFMSSDLVEIERKHNVLRNLDLLTAAGIRHDVPGQYVVPQTWIADEAERHGEIVIHVGTIAHDGLEARRWPLSRFAEIAHRLVADGYSVTALMGPAEKKETLELSEKVPEVKIFEGPLEGTARFLSGTKLALTNDSGIGYLAAAVGAPTIALFGPTPLEHAPYGPAAVALRPSSCPPCFDPRFLNTECALNIGYRCLKTDLPVELVIRAIHDRLLMENVPGR